MAFSEVFFTEQLWCPVLVMGGVARITPAGELDASTVPTLDAALRLGGRLADLTVLDLRELEFIDSSGARLLARAARRARWSGGRLVLDSLPERIERLLRMVAAPQDFSQ